MKMARTVVIAAVCLVAALILPAGASAAITRLDLGPDAQLGSDGAFVSVPVTYQCDFFEGSVFINVEVTQSRGNRMAQGSVFVEVACIGSVQRVLAEVPSRGVPYHQGKAVAWAQAFGTFGGSSDGPEEIQIVH